MTAQNSDPNPATKLVEVRLSALTRVEYTEVVEVPADITPDELDDLVRDRYDKVDGGEYVDDPEYWQRGTCQAVDCDLPNAEPSMMAWRTEDGLHVERADASRDAPEAVKVMMELLENIRAQAPEMIADNIREGWGMNRLRAAITPSSDEDTQGDSERPRMR